jgi:amino acid transporter
MVSFAITVLLSLINIGSTVALNAIVSLTITSLMSSYMISIGCVLLKRLRGQCLPPRHWSLGRFGMAINIGALTFLMPVFVFGFFPLATPVDRATMNWGIVMYGGVIIVATVYYWAGGRHSFTPPVALVKRSANSTGD